MSKHKNKYIVLCILASAVILGIIIYKYGIYPKLYPDKYLKYDTQYNCYYENEKDYFIPAKLENSTEDITVDRHLTLNVKNQNDIRYYDMKHFREFKYENRFALITMNDRYVLKNTSDDDIKTKIYYRTENDYYITDPDAVPSLISLDVPGREKYTFLQFNINGKVCTDITLLRNRDGQERNGVDFTNIYIADRESKKLYMKLKHWDYLEYFEECEGYDGERLVRSAAQPCPVRVMPIIIPANSEVTFEANYSQCDINKFRFVAFDKRYTNVGEYTLTISQIPEEFYSFHNTMGIRICEPEQTFTLDPYEDGYEIDFGVY